VETGVLIIHPGALGDVLQAVPALRGLRDTAPDTPLVFAGQPRLGHLLVALRVVDEARSFDGLGLSALFTDAPAPDALAAFAGRFRRVVSWFGSREATYRARLAALGPDVIVAPPVPDDDTPVWRHLIASLHRWGVAAREPCAPLVIAGPPAPRTELVVHPGSGGAWKRWPVERFARVIHAVTRTRRLPVVLHQGPADADAVEELAARLEVAVERLVEPDLPSLASRLAAARGYLGGDSGVSHLAAAMGAASVIVFPAATIRRWAPWSPTAVAIEMTGEAEDVATVTRALEARLDAENDAARGGLTTGPAPG
jgi:ADP-heptose:LPS heptosyltransferase